MARFSIHTQLAVLMCLIGWEGISPLEPELGVADHFYTIAGAPHLLLALVAIWAGRINSAASAVSLCACAIAAYLPWMEQAGRRTEGFEWRFDNAFGAGLCIIACYGMVLATTAVVYVCSLVKNERSEVVGEG